MITVGNSGTSGIGGIVIVDGRCGQWWCGASLVGGACCVGCCGAWRGGAAGGCAGALVWAWVVVGVVGVVVVVVGEVVGEVVVRLVVDELVPGVVDPLGPRLVNWMTPQITTAIIAMMRAIQAISTDRRRNHGVGGGAAKSSKAG